MTRFSDDPGPVPTFRRFWDLARLIPSFGRSEHGNITIMFGLSAALLLGAVGTAIDYGRWLTAAHQMQVALDSAVLAAGRNLQVTGNAASSITVGQIYFDQMVPTDVEPGLTRTFVTEQNDTVVTGTVHAKISTPFLSFLGVSEMDIPVRSQSVLSVGENSGSNLEITMMLDITGSMAGTKIADLKTAAKDLIDIVVWDDQSSYTSKVAIAPFAPYVNVGSTYISAVTGLPASKTVTTGSGKKAKTTTTYPIVCVTERTGTYAYTDEAPGTGAYVSAYAGDNGTTAQNNSSNFTSTGSCSEPSSTEQILPLTSDKTVLKNKITGLTAGGGTAGQLGVAWAWYLISPNWGTVFTGTSKPAPYTDLKVLNKYGDPSLRKIAILMTDGEFNVQLGTSYSSNSSIQTISNNAVSICTNMKKAGIEVYTVGFQVGGNAIAVDTLKKCATDADHFFNSSTGDALKAAFREIAMRISTLHIQS